MTDRNLSFIVSSGPKLQCDPRVRHLIRRHAMKNVASTRKKRADSSRVNAGQNPPERFLTDVPIREVVSSEAGKSLSSHDATSSDTPSLHSDGNTSFPWLDELEQSKQTSQQLVKPGSFIPTTNLSSPLSATPLSSPYEIARSRFQVDLNDLTMLTNFNVGQETGLVLSEDPSQLLTLLGYSQWSYLQFIPSRYGLSPCLTTAANCVLSKVRGMLMPEKRNENLEIRCHMLALRTLQDALRDKLSCMSSEVLGASQLLALYALLSSSEDETWSHHIHGSARLVKHRAPDRFRTEFDKALFAAHVGPVVFESIMSQKPCHLDQPEWIELYQSIISDSHTLTERSQLAVSIRSQMIMLPRLWHNIDVALKGPELFNDEVQQSLRVQCAKSHRNFIEWMKDYDAYCMSKSHLTPPPRESAIRRELKGVAMECLMIVKRLLASVCGEQREDLEIESQSLAHSLLELHDLPSPKHSWLFVGHEVGVTQSILLTTRQWQEPLTYASEYERKIASRARYAAWIGLLRPGQLMTP